MKLEIERVGKREIKFSFDIEAAELLKVAFDKAMSKDIIPVPVKYSKSLFSNKSNSGHDFSNLIIVTGDSKLLKKDVDLYLLIDPDDMEYANERFRDCTLKKYFSPAELFQVTVGNKSILNDIYCEITK